MEFTGEGAVHARRSAAPFRMSREALDLLMLRRLLSFVV